MGDHLVDRFLAKFFWIDEMCHAELLSCRKRQRTKCVRTLHFRMAWSSEQFFFLSEKTVGEDPHSASNFYKIFKRELQSIFLRRLAPLENNV